MMRGDGDNARPVQTDIPTDDANTAPGKPAHARGGVLTAFRYRDFSILWSGALLSNIGTWIHMSALFWYVKEITGSDAWVGMVSVANFLPVFFLVLYAGSLADILNRRVLIIATQAAMMVGAFALGVASSAEAANLAVIMVITLIMGTAFTFNFPAWRAIITDLVQPRDILNAVALDAAEFNLARFIGPVLGGVIVAASSVSTAFYINALSFLAVIAALLLIRTKTPRSLPPPQGTLKHIREILTYTWENRWAFNVLLVLIVASIFGLPFIVLLPGMAKDVLDKGVEGYTWLLGLVGLGAFAAAPLVTWMNRRYRESEIIKIATLAAGLLLVGFSLSRSLPLSLVFSFGLGASFLMVSAGINTVLQSKVERTMRGRIMSLYILVFQGMLPIGGIVMGVLADRISAPLVLLLGGIACTVMAGILFLFPAFLKEAVSPLFTQDDGSSSR